MGKMKELFTEYQNQMRGQDEFIDDDYLFQQWCEEKVRENSEYWESVASSSIFPDDMMYDDEYYKSTYHPTIEEEAAAFKLLNEQQ
jgi:hypothetical protein